MSDRTVSRAWPHGHTVRAALIAVLTLIAVPFLPSTTSAAPPSEPLTTDPADAAAGWLTGELVDGQYLTSSFDADANGTVDPAIEISPDAGLTADAVLAFAAADSAGDAAQNAVAWLEGQVATYTGDGATESYAGALAKLALVAEVMERDATDFGGQDLVARLLSQLDADGRFADVSEFGDFSSPVTQSLAILALVRADPVGVPPAAVDFLISAQCADGGFVTDPSTKPCTTGEVDATAVAVQALLVSDREEDAREAGAFLVAQQAGDGSFGTDGTGNSNSTGVAAQALRALGEDAPADQATDWLLSVQLGGTQPAEQLGAIPFDSAGFDPSTATRATAQAVLGLAGTGLADLAAPSDPAAYGLETQAEAATPAPDAASPSPDAASAEEETKGGWGLAIWLAVGAGILVVVLIAAFLVRSRKSA